MEAKVLIPSKKGFVIYSAKTIHAKGGYKYYVINKKELRTNMKVKFCNEEE